ncbi:MAG: hypothetical protein CL910_18810 [Deltaproteobacteria bacterium]|nr:hypothetical protein [Deltaproteobacteria bacterium]
MGRIDYTIDAGRSLLHAVAVGDLDDDALAAYVISYHAHPDYSPSLDEIVDFTGVASVLVTGAGIRGLAHLVSHYGQASEGSRVALIATTPVVYGLARMYQALRADAPDDIRVVSDLVEAETWLGAARTSDCVSSAREPATG